LEIRLKSLGDTPQKGECGTGTIEEWQTTWPCLGSHFVGIPFQHSRPFLSTACWN